MTTLCDLTDLRRTEFARLDATNSIYLDYTGAALYPESLVLHHAERLTTSVFGNPHSDNTPSRTSTEAIETARRLTLQFLDADPSQYDVVFTANASGAIRILAEAFPFRTRSRLVMTADNHNSVNGLRDPARRKGATVDYIPLDEELRSLDPIEWLASASAAPALFAFPAQSNFSGVHHPLSWVVSAQQRGYHVLLDAAGFVPSNPLSLREVPADFVALSFYKMFGYPTGVGALVAKREALAILRREYFAGGTVKFVSVQNNLLSFKLGSEGFEDGTQNFLAMSAVCDGLKWLSDIGTDRIRGHVNLLTASLLQKLSRLGDRIAQYGPLDMRDRGGTVAFNLYRGESLLPFESLEVAACDRGIALRGGCFCNPGAAEKALRIPPERARACLDEEFSIQRLRACLGGAPVGALRASVGLATNMRDIDSLIEFAVDATEACIR